MRNTLRFGLLAAVMALSLTIGHPAAQAFQDDAQDTELLDQWHQWRGPLANGVAPHATPPIEWDENTNILWKVPIEGEGISTPIVWGDRIFVLSAVSTERVADDPPIKDERAMTQPPENYFQFTVSCLSLDSGETIWKDVAIEAVPHEGRHKTSSYAAASPMTNGKQLIVHFGSIGTFGYSMDGQQQWSVDLGDMRTRRGWGEATSAVLEDDHVIVNWDTEDDSFIYVLDAASGDVIWQQERMEPTTWATPLVIQRNGRTEIVTNGTNNIRSYDLQSGELLWEHSGTTLNAIPCPVQFGSNRVICMAGYRGNRAVAIDLDESDRPTVAWAINSRTPYVPSPLLSENRLYFTQANQAILSCVNAENGEFFYGPQRLDELQNLYASPIAAAGRVYITSREGVTLVIRDAESFEVLATNALGEGIDASPVAVGSKLLLRGRDHLYCVEEN